MGTSAAKISLDTHTQDALYRHEKREQWGVALFVWERDGKRAFRFADGEVRVFKKGFYEMMIPAATPSDGSADELRALILSGGSGKKGEVLPSVADQLALFLAEYPGGFAGDTWQEAHRGRHVEGSRRLKRHRDLAIAEAREQLAHERIAELTSAGNHTGIRDVLVDLLAATDLVPGAQINALRETRPTRELSLAVQAIARDPENATFKALQIALVTAQGPANSWPILTAPLSLLAPHKHICVRPNALLTQGKIVMLRFTAPKLTEAGYQRYLEVVRFVQDELAQRGHAPGDMLDLHDFMAITLRPGARAELDRLHLLAKA
jgi:hypothetical protein